MIDDILHLLYSTTAEQLMFFCVFIDTFMVTINSVFVFHSHKNVPKIKTR